MTTIIRVKRHREEEPVEALVLCCKRKKSENSSSDYDSTLHEYVLSFSGTIEKKDDKVAASTVESFRKQSNYSELRNKEHAPNIKRKQKKEWKKRSDDSRFTLLSYLRSSVTVDNCDAESKECAQKNISVLDVEREKASSEKQSAENQCSINSEDSYVYDLYSTKVEPEADIFMDLLSVQTLRSEFDYQTADDFYDDENDPDEDDSNDENNWRNDYPDSDSCENNDGSSDSDILTRLKRFHLRNDEYDTSSDGDDEEYLNYNDEEKYCYYQAEDLAGKMYARYKANALRRIINDDDDDDDEGSAEGSCEDSCEGSSRKNSERGILGYEVPLPRIQAFD